MAEGKVKVVYIVGNGRSGSTLLDRLLGQMDDFVTVGELRLIWDWGFEENLLCGCGTPFNKCPFWSCVLEEAFAGPDGVDARRMLEWRLLLERYRNILQLICGGMSARYKSSLKEYTAVLQTIYQAVHDVSGGKVIVDSSKNLPYALVLNRMDNIDIHIIHLVRDSRAVAYSWQRKRVRPEVHEKEDYMYTFSPGMSARGWFVENSAIHMLRPLFRQYTLLRYEDLANRPQEVLPRLCADLGVPTSGLNFIDNATVHLDGAHSVAGNPMRFKTGALDIRPDTQWKEQMSRHDRSIVTALTLPLLLRYGYLWMGHTSGQASQQRKAIDA